MKVLNGSKCLLSLAFVCLGFASWVIANESDLDTVTNDSTLQELEHFIVNLDKKVLTFVGYSGSGYQHEKAMLEQAGLILDQYDPSTTVVNIGATAQGIGAIYPLAMERGFETIGIISSLGKAEPAAVLSPYVGQVFFMLDDTWGGLLEGTVELSPTSEAIVTISEDMVGIGGGEVARDEMMMAACRGKSVRYFPAQMNHAKGREKGLTSLEQLAGAAAKERIEKPNRLCPRGEL